jgi:hypothetical protein
LERLGRFCEQLVLARTFCEQLEHDKLEELERFCKIKNSLIYRKINKFIKKLRLVDDLWSMDGMNHWSSMINWSSMDHLSWDDSV